MIRKMRSLIVTIFCIGVLFSCISEKKRAEICRNCSHKDSVSVFKHDTIIMRDTTVFFNFLGDTISTPCPTHDTVIIKKNGGVVTKIIYKDKQVKCICSDDSLKLVIEKIRTDHYKENDTNQTKTEYLQCDKKHISTWYEFCWWFTLIMLIIIGVTVITFILRISFKK